MKNQSFWLGRPDPLNNETFSSWFRRTATANGLTARELYRAVLPGAHLHSHDLDRLSCPSLIDGLSHGCGVPLDHLRRMTLYRWDGIIDEIPEAAAELIWLPTVGRTKRTKSFGQQICPSCLREDETPHYRCHWRISLFTACPIHKSLLIDRCPSCGNPIQILRRDSVGDDHVYCCHCQFDYRDAVTTLPDFFEHEAQFSKVLLDGWFEAGEHGHIHSLVYFRLLYLLVRLLVSGPHSVALRTRIANRLELTRRTYTAIPRLKEVERLNPRSRNAVLAMASTFLADWPKTFVEIATQANVTSRDLLKANQTYPFLFEDAVRHYLSRSRDMASEEEIVSATILLERQGIAPTRRSVESLIGKKFTSNSAIVPGRECIPYGTHRYWKLDGVSPEVRAAAKVAAHQAGENVGAWIDMTLRRVLTEDSP